MTALHAMDADDWVEAYVALAEGEASGVAGSVVIFLLGSMRR